MAMTATRPDATHLRTIEHFIDGAYVAGTSGRFGDVYDPTAGAVAARVEFAGKADVERAIASSAGAFGPWAKRSALSRARVLARYRDLLETNADRIARTVSSEHGKVIADARASLQRGIEVVEFASGIPHLLKGDFSSGVATGVDMHSLRQPIGVVAGITPFNFPEMVPLWMLPVALACGNAFILKPSEKDPSGSLLLAELFVEAGGPPGVFNCVVGDKEAVDTLLHDPRVVALSFVGSTPIAKYVYATASANGKRVQSMGGAKNHAVVMPDADLDATADALMGAAYGSAGERCMALSVVVAVGDATADAIVARLRERIAKLVVGGSLDAASEMGPLVTRDHAAKVTGYIDAGVAEGATLVVDGRGAKIADHPNGSFVGATLFDRVTTAMSIYREEIFGPVLVVVRARSFDEAIAIVDGHEFGNGTAIFTRDGDAAREYATRIDVGMVGVNVPIPVPMAFYGFGGFKNSAFGDLNQYGEDGVRFYTKTKTVTTRWPGGIRAGSDFHMPTLT
ncbi:MAG: CoA-acylating methylmalonate-semialdehyde dehydrogenase [Vulcanimicrobiaceae bacterium]